MKIYKDTAFWDHYYEENRQYTGKNRWIRNWTMLKDKRLYQDNAYALEQLRRGAYDHLSADRFTRPVTGAAGEEPIVFHAYWCGPFGRKQAFSVKSYLCTQNQEKTKLWLWLDQDNGYEGYEENPYLKPLLPYITVKAFQADQEIIGTPFEEIGWLFHGPELTFRGDGFRILALYKWGGLYFDLDVMFTKDFAPLFANGEFCYTWEKQPYANNAILYLRKGSPLNEKIVRKAIKKQTFRPWILFAYRDFTLSSFTVYPCAFFDPLWQKESEQGYLTRSFDDFFTSANEQEVTSFRAFYPGAYAYHWHNHWKIEVCEDSYFSRFEREFDQLLDIR